MQWSMVQKMHFKSPQSSTPNFLSTVRQLTDQKRNIKNTETKLPFKDLFHRYFYRNKKTKNTTVATQLADTVI